MNFTNISSIHPPTQLVFDYVQISCLSVLVVVGVPVNLYSLTVTVSNYKSNSSNQIINLLKIHLALADLMVLCFFGLSKIFWLSTYQWLAGDFMCKLVQFLISFAFCLCSNTVAIIALIRWMVVKKLHTPTMKHCYRKLRILIFLSYTLAFVCSAPQMLLWLVVRPFPKYPSWGQCVTKFGLARYLRSNNIDMPWEVVYSVSHLLFVFWIPLLIILISYFKVYVILKRNIRRINQRVNDQQSHEMEHFENQFENNISPPEGTASQITINIPTDSSIGEHIPLNLNLGTLLTAKRKFVKHSAYILLAYVLCWSFYNLVVVLQEIGVVIGFLYWRALYNLIVLNAVLNPFLYGIKVSH